MYTNWLLPEAGKQTKLGQSNDNYGTISGWQGLLVKAAREKKWFRDLLEDVMNELNMNGGGESVG